jgi:hypothetical protein
MRVASVVGGLYERGRWSLEDAMEGHISGLQQFLLILVQADNIPIMGMMLLVLFFTYVALKQARRNDQLIEHGERDKIIDEMRK